MAKIKDPLCQVCKHPKSAHSFNKNDKPYCMFMGCTEHEFVPMSPDIKEPKKFKIARHVPDENFQESEQPKPESVVPDKKENTMAPKIQELVIERKIPKAKVTKIKTPKMPRKPLKFPSIHFSFRKERHGRPIGTIAIAASSMIGFYLVMIMQLYSTIGNLVWFVGIWVCIEIGVLYGIRTVRKKK